MHKFHIIGTDTSSGKTHTTVQLMQYLIQSQHKVAALKPIASGAMPDSAINEDVAQLLAATNYQLTPQQINLITFIPPIAPHIAAAMENYRLDANIVNMFIENTSLDVDYLLIEGVGGVMVPLNQDETYLDLLQLSPYPIILVVGMKLGCLNHALLTAAVLKQRGLKLVGWIANQIDPQMEYYQQNLIYLSQALDALRLAEIPYQQTIQPTEFFSELFPCL
ncbi:MAG: dethiobiotin synthase [Burkholderiales bacterium]|jgi:dethiobiotin synthetase|nr:dethiobiotin synthase [Burkholderiales bacterium]